VVFVAVAEADLLHEVVSKEDKDFSVAVVADDRAVVVDNHRAWEEVDLDDSARNRVVGTASCHEVAEEVRTFLGGHRTVEDSCGDRKPFLLNHKVDLHSLVEVVHMEVPVEVVVLVVEDTLHLLQATCLVAEVLLDIPVGVLDVLEIRLLPEAKVVPDLVLVHSNRLLQQLQPLPLQMMGFLLQQRHPH